MILERYRVKRRRRAWSRRTIKKAKTEQKRAVERGEEPPAWTKVVLAECR